MNIAKYLLCTCCIGLSCIHTAPAQNAEELYRKATETQQAETWNKLAEYLYTARKNPTLLRTATEHAKKLAQKNRDSIEWGKAVIYGSDLFYQKGEFQSYQDENRRALKLLRNTHEYGLQEVALNNIATSFGEQDQIDSLIYYTRKAMFLNRLHRGSRGKWGEECQNMAYAYSVYGIADSAYHYTKETIEASIEAKDTLRLLDAYSQMAVFYIKKKQYPDALNYFTKALDIYELVENKHNRLYVYTNLAAMYHKWGKKTAAIKFARHALKDAEGTAEKATYGKLLCNLGLYLHAAGMFRESADTLRMALPLVSESFHYQGSLCQTLASDYDMLGMPDSCEYYLNKVDSLAETHQFVRGELFYASKVALLMHRKNYREAAFYAQRFVKLDEQKELTESSPYIYNMISLALEKGTEDYQTALKYKKKAASMQDSLYQEKANIQMNEFYARYQTTEKELEIASMRLARQKWILAIVGSALMIIILCMITLYQHMKRIRKEKEAADLHIRIQQKEQELEKTEKEMHSHVIDSYFKGIEAERERLAKELHNNVANELLGISMLMKLQPNKSEEAIQQLQKLQKEVRTISHDLMPPIFRQVTLTEILKAHIYNLNVRGNCNFELILTNEQELNKVTEKISLVVYRMVQELSGNIIKYASASAATIEIEAGQTHIKLKISDNGKGFDPQKKRKGVGLQLVKKRIDELKGTFLLDTATGEGCRITITFPL